MPYETLPDPGADAFCAYPVICKFCNMGFVTSKKWTSAYITIADGVVRLYDSKDSYQADPRNHVLQIILTKHHKASDAKKKNYSPDKVRVLELFQFYIEIDNGIFMPTKLIKIASEDPQITEKLVKCIDTLTE